MTGATEPSDGPSDRTGNASDPVAGWGLADAVRFIWADDRREALSLLALAVGLLAFVAHLPGFVRLGGADTVVTVAFYHLWTLAWLLAVGALTRTVPLRTLVSYWLVGVFLVTALAFWVSDLAFAVVGRGEFHQAVVVPIVEEVLKALPVAGYLWLSVRSGNWERTATDGLLVGFAVGAGFDFFEAVAQGRSLSLFTELLAFGHGPWGWLFPFAAETRFGLSVRLWFSHPGWTALVGLALGLALAYRHRRVVWSLPLAMLLLVTLDHAAINRDGIGVLDGLLGMGRVTMALLVVGVVAAVVLDLLLVRRTGRRFAEQFPPVSARWIRAILRGPVDALTLWELKAAGNYARWRRSGLLAMRRWSLAGVDPSDPEATVRWLLVLRAAAEPVDGEWWNGEGDERSDDC